MAPGAEDLQSRNSGELAQDLPVLASQYGLGRVRDWSYLPHGLMNPNWRIEADGGVFALKRLVDVSPEKAERQLEMPRALAAAGIPACAARPAENGSLVVRGTDERAYALFEWAIGEHVPGWELTVDQAAQLGDLLGRLHDAMEQAARNLGWPCASETVRSKVAEPETALAEAHRFIELVSGLPERDEFDATTLLELEQRRVMLDEHAGQRPTDDVPLGPCGWTHGDVQYRNLLWSDGRVSAILDWDRVGVRALAEEVARTVAVQFAREDGVMDLQRVAAFVEAYRSVVPLKDEHLADASRRLWWRWLTDLWPLNWHYERGDRSCDALWSGQARLLEWWSGHMGDVELAMTGSEFSSGESPRR